MEGITDVAPAGFRTVLPPWMACYVLLGFVQSGLLPVILPLAARPVLPLA